MARLRRMASLRDAVNSTRVECPFCASVMLLAKVERLQVAAGREADMVQPYRCRVCGHIFAPRDLTAVSVDSPPVTAQGKCPLSAQR